jgi:hypothetical protein
VSLVIARFILFMLFLYDVVLFHVPCFYLVMFDVTHSFIRLAVSMNSNFCLQYKL